MTVKLKTGSYYIDASYIYDVNSEVANKYYVYQVHTILLDSLVFLVNEYDGTVITTTQDCSHYDWVEVTKNGDTYEL